MFYVPVVREDLRDLYLSACKTDRGCCGLCGVVVVRDGVQQTLTVRPRNFVVLHTTDTVVVFCVALGRLWFF